MKGSFRSVGNVFDPDVEEFAVELKNVDGSVIFSATLPTGLEPKGRGFSFKGPLGGGLGKIKLKSKDGVTFKVAISVKNATIAQSALPQSDGLVRIGNDCFEALVPCKANKKGTTETCRPPKPPKLPKVPF